MAAKVPPKRDQERSNSYCYGTPPNYICVAVLKPQASAVVRTQAVAKVPTTVSASTSPTASASSSQLTVSAKTSRPSVSHSSSRLTVSHSSSQLSVSHSSSRPTVSHSQQRLTYSHSQHRQEPSQDEAADNSASNQDSPGSGTLIDLRLAAGAAAGTKGTGGWVIGGDIGLSTLRPPLGGAIFFNIVNDVYPGNDKGPEDIDGSGATYAGLRPDLNLLWGDIFGSQRYTTLLRFGLPLGFRFNRGSEEFDFATGGTVQLLRNWTVEKQGIPATAIPFYGLNFTVMTVPLAEQATVTGMLTLSFSGFWPVIGLAEWGSGMAAQ